MNILHFRLYGGIIMSENCAVILAGGKGKRMQSELPKVLCEVLGKPMIDYVIDACKKSVRDICVIVGYRADIVRAHLPENIETAVQSEQLGTGHAVMQAADFIKAHSGGSVLVLCGDAPLMDEKVLSGALAAHLSEDNAITVITARLSDPASYGRIVKKNGKISGIVEFKDADEQTKAINEINSGAYWFKADVLSALLPRLENNNAQGEYYLTDTVKLALSDGLTVNSYVSDRPEVVLGANDKEQLAELNETARRLGL